MDLYPGAAKASPWQRIVFLAGSAALFLALASPLDALAEISFAVHQTQHLMLHTVAPMLLALSAPAAALIAGLPHALRRRAYAPIASVPLIRATFALLSSPVVATAHFLAALLFWQLPAVQEQALIDGSLHDLMHFSMLISGIFFYFCVFDPRPPPVGARFGARVFALLAVLLVNVQLGAYLSYKEGVLYPGYGERRLGLDALADERIGGLLQYVPGSMMLVIAVLLVLAAWRRHESRLEGWRARGFVRRRHDADTLARTARGDLRLALTLGSFCAFMFVAVIVAGLLALR